MLQGKLKEGCYAVQWLENALQQLLQKAEPDSSLCNASFNKTLHFQHLPPEKVLNINSPIDIGIYLK